MKKRVKLLNLIILLTAVVSLSACETIKGAGQDIENGGEAIQRAAS